MTANHVVGLGLCVVDHFYLVERFETDAIRTRYSERLESAGGHVGTALCQVAALGCRARVLAAVGADAGGSLVRAALRQHGVDTRGLLASKRQRTTVAVVLVERETGERRFVVPQRRGMEAAAPRFDLGAIDARSVLLVDGHFPKQALRAVRRAREVGALVVADFHRVTASARALLPYVDHAIVSDEMVRTGEFASPRAALSWLAERSRGAPVMTQGARGGLWLDGKRFRRYAPRRARVVDTTGAGDVFHGAFAAGCALGMAFEARLEMGARAAALNCSALGGAGRLMTRDALPSALRRAASSSRSRPGR